jgi:hypothetical protein
MKTAYYKYSYGKWILVGYVTEEIKPLKLRTMESNTINEKSNNIYLKLTRKLKNDI